MYLYKKILYKLTDILSSITAINCKLDELVLPYYGIVTSAPVDPPTGDDPVVVLDTNTGILYYWNGVSWNVASGDTHMGNTDLVFTGLRTYDANNSGIIYNDANFLQFHTIGPNGVLFDNDTGIGDYSSLQIANGRVDLSASGGASVVYVTPTGLILGNAAGEYFLGDGFFNLAPPVSDVTPDYNIGQDSTTGKLYRTTKAVIPSDLSNLKKDQIGILIDGGGAAITTGYKGRFRVPYSGTITGWTILEVSETPVTGSIVVDVKLGTYANYDTTPTFASIAGSEKPTITTSEKGQDNTLTTWTTAVAAGDLIEYTVDSATDVEKVQLFIDIAKS